MHGERAAPHGEAGVAACDYSRLSCVRPKVLGYELPPYYTSLTVQALAAMSNSYHKANPADAGWTYEGSNAQSRVDFYEKDGCKMDYYPTTGRMLTLISSLQQECCRLVCHQADT